MYLSEPECTLLLGWGLQFWTRWLCFLYVARKAQAFPRRRTLCSSSWLKDWNCILFHHCEIQELTLEGAASDPLVLSAGSSELHKAFSFGGSIYLLHADRLDGNVRSHKWMVWYVGVDFPGAEERTKPGFWNMEWRLCAPASCWEWVPVWDQIPLACYRCFGNAQNVPIRVLYIISDWQLCWELLMKSGLL